MKLGLEPRRIHWLDIPYTSSAAFRRIVRRRTGIPRENFWVTDYSVLEPYSGHQLRRTQEVLRHLLSTRPSKLLVLDDGAYFLEAASAFRRQLPRVAIVEQTTRGMIKLEENAALRRCADGCPVIDVARSRPKRDLESPWIGASVLAALEKHIAEVRRISPRHAIVSHSDCLVLGYGAIGRQVASYARSIARVQIWDSDWRKRAAAARDGFRIWHRERHRTPFKLVVGCTGRASFGVGDYVYLDRHAILASASSGSVELSRRDFIDLASATDFDDIEVNRERLRSGTIHQPLWFRIVDRDVVFLNAGFPINFDGRINCIPSKYMEATAMLMVNGALQAVRARGCGIKAVRRSFARALTRDFRAGLAPAERAALRGPRS